MVHADASSCVNIGRKTDQDICNTTGPRRIIQEASSKSDQGDQEVRRVVNGERKFCRPQLLPFKNTFLPAFQNERQIDLS
jgi:hypothetical protein